jgi:hypothetical protein
MISESGVIVTSISDAAVQLRTLPQLFHMVAMLSSKQLVLYRIKLVMECEESRRLSFMGFDGEALESKRWVTQPGSFS